LPRRETKRQEAADTRIAPKANPTDLEALEAALATLPAEPSRKPVHEIQAEAIRVRLSLLLDLHEKSEREDDPERARRVAEREISRMHRAVFRHDENGIWRRVLLRYLKTYADEGEEKAWTACHLEWPGLLDELDPTTFAALARDWGDATPGPKPPKTHPHSKWRRLRKLILATGRACPSEKQLEKEYRAL
jgi:hypothetical protein